MATEYVNLTGRAYWAKLSRPEDYMGDKRWCIDVYFEGEELEKYKKIGLHLQPIKKPATDKGVGYKFRRSVTKRIKGEDVEFDPPVVQDADRKPFTDMVGNGSLVKINLAVYDAGRVGKGHRLQGVTVLDLVPYERPALTSVSEKKGTAW